MASLHRRGLRSFTFEPRDPRLSRRRALATWLAVSVVIWVGVAAVIAGVARWERHVIAIDAEHLSKIRPASGNPTPGQ